MSIAALASISQQALNSIFNSHAAKPKPGSAACGETQAGSPLQDVLSTLQDGASLATGGLTNDVSKLGSDLLGTLGLGDPFGGSTVQQASSAYASSARLAV